MNRKSALDGFCFIAGDAKLRIITLELDIKRGFVLFNSANIAYNIQIKECNKSAKHDPDGLYGAAQFSPFAALTGYDAAIAETARLTDERRELSDDMREALNMKLGMLEDVIADRPEVSVTYFQKDAKKAGGAYITVTGAVKKIDDYEGVLVLANGKKIKIVDVLDIESELFKPSIFI